jgi:hypothetical protein
MRACVDRIPCASPPHPGFATVNASAAYSSSQMDPLLLHLKRLKSALSELLPQLRVGLGDCCYTPLHALTG